MNTTAPGCDIILLDGEQRSALAALRTLAGHGLRVAVGSHHPTSLSSVSRFCAERFTYPSPYASPAEFVDRLRTKTRSMPGAVLLPMTDVSAAEVLEHRSEFSGNVSVPFVDYGTYEQVTDKARLSLLAGEIGVPMPRTAIFSGTEDADTVCSAAERIGYPVVIKPSRSKIKLSGRWVSLAVSYARRRSELAPRLDDFRMQGCPFVVQEAVGGPGIGVFFLADRGKIVASFAHKRIREKPPSGGVSTLCESIPVPDEALRSSSKIAERLGWTGVAMVEFKKDVRDSSFKLIEVNARFWGSLRLAIAAGVDFPYLLYRLARGEQIAPVTAYRSGLRLRWFFGELDHLIARINQARSKPPLPSEPPPLARTCADLLTSTFAPGTVYDVWDITDPFPALYEAYLYARSAVCSMKGPRHG